MPQTSLTKVMIHILLAKLVNCVLSLRKRTDLTSSSIVGTIFVVQCGQTVEDLWHLDSTLSSFDEFNTLYLFGHPWSVKLCKLVFSARAGSTLVHVWAKRIQHCFTHMKTKEMLDGESAGVLPKVRYTGRLRPKGVPFFSSQYIKR